MVDTSIISQVYREEDADPTKPRWACLVRDVEYGWEEYRMADSEEEARQLAAEWLEEFRMRRGSATLMAAAKEGCNSPESSKWECG